MSRFIIPLFVAFPRFCAIIAALLLVATRGAPLEDRLGSSSIVAAVFGRTMSDSNDVIQRLLGDETYLRVSRSSPDTTIVVTINSDEAKKLRDKMNDMTEDMIAGLNAKAEQCGKAKIGDKMERSGEIPSIFYPVECPEKCDEDKVGARVVRVVSVKTVHFKQVKGDEQYEVEFRRQIVGCCLEDGATLATYHTHPITVSEPSKRR